MIRARSAAALAVAIAASAPAAGATLTAGLSADQQPVPPVGVPFAAAADFHGTLTTGRRLRWRLTTFSAGGPVTSARIHLGRRGVRGPAVLTLCAPCRNRARGSLPAVPARVAAALRSGRAYVNLATAANPDGALRGQVALLIRGPLAQSGVIPAHPPRPETRGVRRLTALLDGPRMDAQLILQGIGSRVTRAEIRRGAEGATGPVLRTLCAPCGARTDHSWTLDPRALADLRRGALHLQVFTARDAGGYARAQLATG